MTPFELRAQLLKQAQEYLQTQYEHNLEFAKRSFDELVKTGKETQDQFATYMPCMYSFDEITQKANQLYGFVKEKQ